jgi:hypothetical protein
VALDYRDYFTSCSEDLSMYLSRNESVGSAVSARVHNSAMWRHGLAILLSEVVCSMFFARSLQLAANARSEKYSTKGYWSSRGTLN